MTNLFSVFEPSSSLSLINNWAILTMASFILPPLFWPTMSQWKFMSLNMTKTLSLEFKQIVNIFISPGMIFLAVSYFTFIVAVNAMGLLPYIFTCSSHLTFTISLALPLWLGHIVWSWFMQVNSSLAHLVPLGTPMPLAPFMVLIEMVSSLIRPLTLSVRLAANMVAGHLLLTLLSANAPNLSWAILMSVMSALLCLSILESAVAIIQAYVFSVLSLLYVDEVSTKNLI